MAALPFLVILIIPSAVVAALLTTGPVAWLPVALLFAVIPLADAAIGLNHHDVPEERWRDRIFAWIPRIFVPMQLSILIWGLATVATSTADWSARILWIADLGILTGVIGINFAHELMHHHGRLDRGLAEVLMGCVTYSHFCIEHVAGHHRHVATDGDPATARLGEGLYRFWLRSIGGGLRSAWHLEAARLARRKRPVVSPGNRMIRYAIEVVLLYAAVGLWLGPVGLIALAGQSLVAVLLLETVNYLEHYGLVRRRRDDGRYERVQPWHSWNASFRLSNWLLLNLARHSDHHAEAARPYQALRHLDDAPQLPTGYAGMLMIALVPPLWRWVMDRRVAAWKERWGPLEIDATEPAAG